MQPKKIILISIDTLRADHLGCYGYRRNTSPCLDSLAKTGIIFKNTFSPSSFTIPAHASIFTGKYPSNHSIGFNQISGKINGDVDISLPEVLRSLNMRTAAFLSSFVLRKETKLDLGFDTYDDVMTGHELNRPDVLKRDCSETISEAVNWLDTHSMNDFFLFIHLMDVHGAYVCPEPYDKLFVGDSLDGTGIKLDVIVPNDKPVHGIPEYQVLNCLKNGNGEIISFETNIDTYISQYDGCIRYVDSKIESLLKKLMDLKIYDDVLLIITSDHGEAFGENDIYLYHGLTVTREQILVPLIIKPNKNWQVENRSIEVPVSTIDIMPTILELCGFSYNDLDLQGNSLKNLITDNRDHLIEERTLMSENETQYALIYPNQVMEFFKKEIPSSHYYPAIPELTDSLNGEKIYWDSGKEYVLSLPFDIYQRYKLLSDIINKFRNGKKRFSILDVGAGYEETLKKFLPDDDIFQMDKDLPPAGRVGRNYIVGDFLKTKLDQKFDFVVSIDVFEHISHIDRQKFVDILIEHSKIASIVSAPFNEQDVRNCEILANEVYKLSHGSDYVWLKEHIVRGLPSLPHTVELIQRHRLNFVVIPNGYLPRWFEMISVFLLTEGNPKFSRSMKELNEFYNKNFYRNDNQNPAYRQTIVIMKPEGKLPDFSDLFSTSLKKDDDTEFLFTRFTEKIKLMVQNDCLNTWPELSDLRQKILDRDTKILDLNQQIAAQEVNKQEIYSRAIVLENEIKALKMSLLFQVSSRFHEKVIGRIFPENTKRGQSYQLVLKGTRILFKEGWKNFSEQYAAYKKEYGRGKFNRIESVSDIIKEAMSNEAISADLHVMFPDAPLDPEVTIIIPVFNNWNFTRRCLESVSKNTQGKYQVVVVDDVSTDITSEMLAQVRNIVVIRNKENSGFIESCNRGAKAADGKYLFFLNNDTIVTRDWLQPLLKLIRNGDAGAVGSRLIYPDGKLQEAGAIIWNDASGWNYGRGDNPEKPEYNFIRDVDYCSGAALLVKREIFENIGGFDRLLKPAYYEDADLCFSIRKMGYRVLYQPASIIIHFEGISNGTDLAGGIKQNQKINQEKFLYKWKTILQESHFPPDSRNVFTARTHSSGKKILVIDQHIPFFDRDAGSYRMCNILKILNELGHKVTFIGDNFNQFDPYDSIMQQAGIEVVYSPFVSSIKQYLSKSGENFDIVIISRPFVAQKHLADIRKYCKKAKVVYDTVDLGFLRESRKAAVKKDPQLLAKANDLKKVELNLAKMSDVTLVVSTAEQQILRNEDPSLNVEIISLIHTIIPPTTKFAERKDIFFLGAFLHTPNADGALWFVKEIFPKIKKQKPDMKVFLVGDRPTKEILELSSDDVIVTGYVEDLSEYFNKCRVFVAPLRYGAGVKGKINQSMSRGLPVVTTSIGAEGMGIVDGENALIADDPELFSQKVIRLYDDEKLWNAISSKSIEHIKNNTSYERSRIHIKHFIESLFNQI